MRLIVNPHKVDIIKDELVNEREIDISKCTFEFAEEITQKYVKEAYFTYNGETYKQIINNNECAFPSEVLQQKGMVEIGVVAYLVQNEQEIKRYNPSPAYFDTIKGSLKDAENSEPITPSEMEQFEQQLQNGLNSIDAKIDEVDTKMETVDTKIDEIDTAIEETNNLDLDVNKQNNKTTVTLTKKNGSTKSVDVLDGTDGQDGTSLEFMWQGTSLGIKTDDMQDYVFVDLQGVQGPIGETGEPFTIKKTYSSIAEMNADFDNMELGDYVMIASSVEIEDNAKLFTKGESAWIFITDFSGAMGIRGETGLTPNIQIGTVVTGETSSVTRTGTNENPILNFVLEKGEKGQTGSTGPQGETGNGIVSVTKTSTSGLIDTYTITYTNGNTSTFNITNGEDGEVTQEQLDKVIKDLEYWKTTNNALPKVTGEGTDITLDNTADSPLSLELKTSESTQNSEPSPDYPQDIHVIKGDNEIVVSNKNLFDKDFILDSKNNYYQKYARFIFYKLGNNFKKQITVSMALKGTSQSLIMGFSDIVFSTGQADTRILSDGTIKTPKTFDFSNSNDVYVYFANTSGLSVNLDEVDLILSNYNIQVEKGTEATPYVEHKEQSYPINLGVKNKFNPALLSQVANYNTYDENTGLWTTSTLGSYSRSILYNANGATTTRDITKLIPLEANKTYTIKIFDFVNTTTLADDECIGYSLFDNNGTQLDRQSAGNEYTFSTTETSYLDIRRLDNTGTFSFSKIQIEEGDTAHSYSPYGQTPIEMCKISTYADELFKNVPECEYYDESLEIGKWYKLARIGKIVLNGTENWFGYRGQSAQYLYRAFGSSGSLISVNTGAEMMSNYFKQNVNAINNANDNGIYCLTNNILYMSIDKNLLDDTEPASLKKFLLQQYNANSPVIVYYVFATPENILLSNTLQTQLDNILYAMAYQDQTNISQANEDRPFVINASTVKDMKTLEDRITTIEQSISL